MTLPAETLRSEIARLTRQRNELNILGWVDPDPDFDWDADLAAQIADLRDELADLAEAEPLPLSNAA